MNSESGELEEKPVHCSLLQLDSINNITYIFDSPIVRCVNHWFLTQALRLKKYDLVTSPEAEEPTEIVLPSLFHYDSDSWIN